MTNGGTDKQGGTWLVRMVVLLLSLASLADRAGNYPRPVRRVLLRAMRRAEAFEILAQTLDELLPYGDALQEPAEPAAGLCLSGPDLNRSLQRLQQLACPATPLPGTS